MMCDLLSGEERKLDFGAIRSVDDPKADIRPDLFAAQKKPGRYRGFRFGGERKPDQYFATTGLPQLKR